MGPRIVDGVDTSVLVRYLVQDVPEQGEAAARLMDGDAQLAVGLVTLAETAFVLQHHYSVPRDEVVDALIELLQKRNLHVMAADKHIVIAMLGLCRGSGRVSFADALINAEAQTHKLARVYTFDRRFPAEGLVITQP